MRSNKRLSALALVVVAAGLSLTACGPEDPSAAGTTSSPSSASDAASSPSAAPDEDGSSGSGSSSGSSGSGSSGSSSTSGGSGSSDSGSGSASGSTCKTSNLTVSTQHGISGEGQEVVSFKNSGSATCTMHGYAGVDLKGAGDGSDDAVSATRGGSTDFPTVKLAPGEETQFVLNYPMNESGGSGYTFTTMTVTPPNETHSKTLSTSINIPLDNPDQASKPGGIVIYAVGTGK